MHQVPSKAVEAALRLYQNQRRALSGVGSCAGGRAQSRFFCLAVLGLPCHLTSEIQVRRWMVHRWNLRYPATACSDCKACRGPAELWALLRSILTTASSNLHWATTLQCLKAKHQFIFDSSLAWIAHHAVRENSLPIHAKERWWCLLPYRS